MKAAHFVQDPHSASFAGEMAHIVLLSAFRGIKAVAGIEGLSNPRGFTLVDQYQRNPKFKNVHAVGVCETIPPMGPTPVPCGVRGRVWFRPAFS